MNTRLRYSLASTVVVSLLALGCGSDSSSESPPNNADGGADATVAVACPTYTDIPASVEANLSVGPGCVRAGQTRIKKGAVLTVVPGTTVFFTAGGFIDAGENEPGTLVAVGTADKPIRFTSFAASPQAGDWQCLFLGKNGVDSDLQFVNVEYGGALCKVNGSPDNLSSIIVVGGIRGIKNASVSDSLSHGIKITDKAGIRAFENVKFSRNGKNGEPSIWVGANEVIRLGAGLTFDDADEYIKIDDTFPAKESGTWLRQAVPLRLAKLAIHDSAEITIAAGNKIQVAGGTIEVFQANLVTAGTADAPVVFTSANASPQKGDWGCIYFANGKGIPSLKHTIIEYAGNGNGCSGAKYKVAIAGPDNLAFDNVQIRNIDGAGIRTSKDCTMHGPWCAAVMFGAGVTPHFQCGNASQMTYTCP